MIQYDFDAIIERRGTSCEKWDSYPADILPLWVADSDFRAPLPVIEAIQAVAARGIFGYSKADGKFEAAYAGWMQKRFGWQVSPDWVEWCPSQGSALALAIRVFTSPGDNVAMLSPIYPPFIHLCTLNERNPVQSVLHGPGYCIDYCDLEEKLSLPATRLLLLCNPHNPTGRVFTRTELERIGELCLRHGVVVFSDEIHCDFVYAGKHIPFPLLSPELANTTLVGINASKTFNLADLRSAAVISSNEKLRQAFAAGRDRVKLGRCSLGVAGVIAAYEKCEDYADQLRVYVSQNISWTVEHLRREMPSIKAYAPEGTFLLWLDCRALGGTQAEREAFFLEKAKVALNAGESFGNGGEGFMRMNLACPRSTVREAMARLQRVS